MEKHYFKQNLIFFAAKKLPEFEQKNNIYKCKAIKWIVIINRLLKSDSKYRTK